MPHLGIETIAGLNWKDYGGDGPAMVLVHGLGGSSIDWDAVGPRLAKDRRVVAPDLPGFGDSAPRADFTLDTHVDAVADFVEAIGVPVVLVGNSMGGLVAAMFAARHPEMVDRLVLVAPATPPRLPDPQLHWPTVGRLLLEATPGLGYLLARAIRRHFSPEEIVSLGLRAVTHRPSRVPPEVVDTMTEMARRRVTYPWAAAALNQSAFSIAMLYRQPRRFVSIVRRIRAKTLVVQGVADRIVSPGAVAWLCSLRSDWELVTLGDTGHTPQLDAPVRFTRVLEGWLDND